MVAYLGVLQLRQIVNEIGTETLIAALADRIEADFHRWPEFDKSPRYASHSARGVVELMPAADAERFAFKYVNGHPGNGQLGLQTVAAFGMLADVDTGYPVLISEMTILTALRTAATSAMAARHLARKDSRTMAVIGLGAQSEFQSIAFSELLGIENLRIWDTDPIATKKFLVNMQGRGIAIHVASGAEDAAAGADIVTTVTADKKRARILSGNMIAAGTHINAVGGDCPGKTELGPEILERGRVFVEHTPQTRIEGELQQMPADFPVTELWQVIRGEAPGRTGRDDITVFDSVGFAIEDFSALSLIYDLLCERSDIARLDLIASPSDPRDLFGLLTSGENPQVLRRAV
ncbi:ornithine cyclodeaminase [Croceicoccus ponticola]|uniref:Ornithine cyclodeaminase n=1 Tax=Croceicoccus ponticola TaxID=2217664 RepID=A0A437GW53_9SPHN|nr:ornithine cyclodeaminase [Croceicoccus ponticola]RVQ66358.1 ornithine cyclodeaminase [Croceicoccus ponticola]